MDQTIKQFCDWYITGMSALEWSSKNVTLMKAFGLNLDGLSESAQMNVGEMEDDFEELYDLYGDKMKMHPLVRIPIRTCMMVYMVHLTNQMTLKAPIPNIDQILKTNPDIARQLATAAMQQQTTSMRAPPSQMQQAVPVSNNPLAGLSSFMSGMIPPPPPQQTNSRPPPAFKSPIKLPQQPKQQAQVQVQAPPAREMKPPQVNIDDLLRSVNSGTETTKKVSTTPKKAGGSTGKNSVTIKL
jgi:enamine deaminase RidA (YjgF/YER057c/UK114 family)